jgi:hypothetical protein
MFRAILRGPKHQAEKRPWVRWDFAHGFLVVLLHVMGRFARAPRDRNRTIRQLFAL